MKYLIYQTWYIAPPWDYGSKWALNNVMSHNIQPNVLVHVDAWHVEDAKWNCNLTWIAASCKLISPWRHGLIDDGVDIQPKKVVIINKRIFSHNFYQEYNILLGVCAAVTTDDVKDELWA